MKKIIIEDVNLENLYQLVSDALGDNKKDIILNKVSSDFIYKKLEEGELENMEEDMKISKSIFFRGYFGEQGIFVQISYKKMVIFFD